MIKTYMVVRNGAAKKTGEIYSIAQRVQHSKDKTNEWLDEKDKYWCDELRPVGTLINVEQMEVHNEAQA